MNSGLREVLCHQRWRAQVSRLLWQAAQREQIHRVKRVKRLNISIMHISEIPFQVNSSWSQHAHWSLEHIDATLDYIPQFSFI